MIGAVREKLFYHVEVHVKHGGVWQECWEACVGFFVLILAMFCRSVSHLSNGLLRVEKRYTKARDIRKTVLKLR